MEHFDVLIVGAGISGIGAAYHLQHKCPGKRFLIVEARDTFGGTWDLFKYPGIRSDSDMYTLGFGFKPWTDAQGIADGPSIMRYLEETVDELHLHDHIRYGTKVVQVSWSSEDKRWTLRCESEGEQLELSCGFLFICAGYYRYDQGYTPELAGAERFGGRIVHPQLWTEDIDYANKRVIVIGSGATAVTLVPEMAKDAAHVVMLQRSPTYIFNGPRHDPLAGWLRGRVPEETAYHITRWKNVIMSTLFYELSRRFPARAKKFFLDNARQELGADFDIEKHFTPSYNVWDQRVCLDPDGDLFSAIREERVSVVTDHIETITEKGIMLRSGEELEADLIVTATGLQLQFLGGVELLVDGERKMPSDLLMYKGMMFGGVPNLAMSIGYTNASWTLKVDLTCDYVCRLLNLMDRRGYQVCVPEADPTVEPEPIINFSSGYVRRALAYLPRQGDRRPWRMYQSYILDRLSLRHGRVDDGVMRLS